MIGLPQWTLWRYSGDISSSILFSSFQAISVIILDNLTSGSDIDYQYPPGIIRCKTYQDTHLDCSNRLLADIPPLEQNLTTLLNLSYNHLKEIRGKPFEKLRLLRYLDMRMNKIFRISSIAFSDIPKLELLHLHGNMLASLPEDIFVNLTRLKCLIISGNLFTILPPKLNWMTQQYLEGLAVSNSFSSNKISVLGNWWKFS